jgi:hypothetical protein
MASILTDDESEVIGYAPDSDDVKCIRRDCRTQEDWQSQLVRSLQLGGWTCGMLLYLPAPLPFHWIMILKHECSFELLNELTLQAHQAYKICGNDRRLWMALACRTLTGRGWTPTMLSRAWQIPKTNIYRHIETELAQESESTRSA